MNPAGPRGALSQPCCGPSTASSHEPETVLLDGKDSLARLAERAAAFRWGGAIRITVSLPGWTETENLTLAAEVERQWNECGCSLGSAGALLSVAAYLLAVFLHLADAGQPLGRLVWHAVLVFSTGAFVGKFLGIRVARQRLSSRLRQLARRAAAAD